MPDVDRHTRQSAELVGANIDLAEYLSFLQLDHVDTERLRALLPLFAETSQAFVDDFYRHLLAFPATARFLQDPQQVARLKELQRAHWQSTLASEWDDEFVERRMAVGRAHAIRGVDPLLFLGSNYRFVDFLVRSILDGDAERPSEQTEQILSVLKAVFLDASLTLESYFSKMTEDLRQALDMVWKANDRLRQFARLTSHDLKTPLATVTNLCEEVLDEYADELPGDASELVQRARSTIYRMVTTIDELLAASMPTAHDVSDDEVEIAEVIDEALEQLRPRMHEKEIAVMIADAMPTALGNRVQLREVFYNLLSNAEKYIDNRPGRIDIRATIIGGESLYSIEDNGPGIPLEELERVFSAFRRLPMHKDRPGSGLGLYFARSLVEHQGGRIWAESEPGRGSCFYVALKRPSPA